MLDKKTREKINALKQERKRNLGKLIYFTNRFFTEWATNRWKEDGWWDIRPGHISLIANVGTEAVNNKELAKRAGISKQAMSKMVKELEQHNFVQVEKDPNDTRSNLISLAKEGGKFLLYLQQCHPDLNARFVSILGEQKTALLADILMEFVEGVMNEDLEKK